jgi:hypothetical protein
MNVFFDLNVLIDIGSGRAGMAMSHALYDQVRRSALHTGAFAAAGYTTLWYILRPLIGAVRTRAALEEWRRRLTLLPFNERTAAVAHRLALPDFEDACQAATAFEGQCDVIATRNVRDFAQSPIPAMTPEALLAQL